MVSVEVQVGQVGHSGEVEAGVLALVPEKELQPADHQQENLREKKTFHYHDLTFSL